MAFKILDRVQVSVASAPGAGSITLSSPAAGFQTFSQAGASNNDTTPYLLVDGYNWEFGIGTYVSATPGLQRTTITASSNSGAAINASANAMVMATVRAEDIKTLLSQMNDVAFSGLASGQVPTWNGSAWVNQTPAGGSTTLAADTDVSLTSPTNDQLLAYDATASLWKNKPNSLARFRGEAVPFAPPQASWFNFSSSGVTTAGANIADQGLLITSAVQSGGNCYCFGKRSVSGWGSNWSVTARMRVGNHAQRAYVAAFLLVGDTSGKLCSVGYGGLGVNSPMGLNIQKMNSSTSFNNTYLGSTTHYTDVPPELLRIRYDGTALYYSLSWDGGNTWETFTSYANDFLGTLSFVGIGGDNHFGASALTASQMGMFCTYYDDPDYPASAHYGS